MKKIRMIHYTCDRCRRDIDTDTEVRYSVEIEVTAVFDCSPDVPSDLEDTDHLLELHEILERLDDEPVVSPRDTGNCKRQFDLCSDCHKVYLRNPLAREMPVTIQFSEN
jgi:hypothetical protein